ncbi:MAG: prolyl oligopeptidase family serine peptidase, partial [Gemmatimonadales bacterium]
PDDSGKAQIWILPLALGGEAVMVTTAKRGVRQLAWRPDGGALAFVSEDEPPAREGTERHNKSFVVERNDYLASAAPLSRHIWTVPSDGGDATRLTSGAWSLASIFELPVQWSPDGATIYFVKQAGPGTGHWYTAVLGAVTVATGAVRDVGPFGMDPTPSADGRWVAYSGPRGKVPEFTTHGIYVLPAAGGAPELQSDIDVTFWEPRWLDQTTLLLCGDQGTRTRLWVKPLGGRSTPIETGALHPSCSSLDVGASGAIAMVANDGAAPAELYWLDRPGATPRRLTDLNRWIGEYAIGRSEGVSWKTDRFTADGVLTFPPDAAPGAKLPLVLNIHGGPMGQSITDFQPLSQLLAAEGFLVFQPNYRGSTGLGNAYQSAVIGDAGDGPGRDVMAGVRTLIQRGIVDTTRMGVSGWSYGGYMTTWLMSHYPVWVTGMAGAAVTDYADGYYLADYGPSFGAAWGGSPFKPPYDRIVREQSPITYAGRIKAPMLILATTGDARVPVVQSYKLYSALKDFGVPVTFVAYPVPGHFPSDPVHIRDVMRRWSGWFAEKLGGR